MANIPVWHSTDDDVSMATSPVTHAVPQQQSVDSSSDKTLRFMSALIGVFCSIFLVSLFFNPFTALRGALHSSSVSDASLTVTITSDGVFSPSTISLSPGSSLTFINQHRDPQVIKLSDGVEVFPSQVVFTDPITISLPSSLPPGESIYLSETLPETSLLRVKIVAKNTSTLESRAVDQLSSSFSSSIASSAPLLIPIPFAEGPSSVPKISGLPASSVSSSAFSSSFPVIIGDPVVLSITSSLSDSLSSSPSFTTPINNTSLPRNTYTVGTRSSRLKNTAPVASAAKTTPSRLHGGAPLRPRVIASTGVETWLLFAVGCFALYGTSVMFRRSA